MKNQYKPLLPRVIKQKPCFAASNAENRANLESNTSHLKPAEKQKPCFVASNAENGEDYHREQVRNDNGSEYKNGPVVPCSQNAPTKAEAAQDKKTVENESPAKQNIATSNLPNVKHKDPFQAASGDKEKLSPYELAELLIDRYTIKALSEHERLGVYYEDFGYYKLMKKRQWPLFLLKALAGTPYKRQLTKGSMDAIFLFLVHEPALQASFDDFDRHKELINVRNGVVSIDDLKLRPHSPKYMFTSYLHVDFNPQAKKPKRFLEMMEDMFDSEDERQLCIESLAYCICNDTTAKKLIFLFGVPSSGKTALSQLLLLIHGSEFVSAIEVERFGGRFELGSIMNKRVNLCPEVERITPRISRVVKAVTGGDSQTLEDKFEDMNFGHLKLKLLLMGNPPLPDVPVKLAQDTGFISRFLFVYFKHTIPVSQRCENIATLLFEQEGEGILYHLLLTLKAWYRRGKEFVYCESSEAQLDAFAMRRLQTERSFVKDCCVSDEEAFESKALLYEHYVKDCSTKGERPHAYEEFVSSMLAILPTLREDRKRVEKGGNPVAVLCGIRLNKIEQIG